MNLKLILVGSVAALVPVVAVPTALSLSSGTSTKESPELSVPEKPSIPPYLPHPPLAELRDTSIPSTLDNLPFLPTLDSSETLTDVSDYSYHTFEADAERQEFREKLQTISEPARTKLSGFGSSFGYDQIDSNKGNRKEQFNKFVEQTDKLRTESAQEIKSLLSKDEFKDKDLPYIFREGLGFELMSTKEGASSDYSKFVKLSIIRKAEVETQVEKDKSLSGIIKMGERIDPEDIQKFCNSPSEDTSHLGMYSSSRKDKEETKEYMFFNYFSYCSKESYYIKLYFDSYHWQSH